MIAQVFTLAALGLTVGFPSDKGQLIEGVVVNGSRGGTPVPGAEVVLRAGEEGALVPVARATTDPDGRFVFGDLPAEPGVVYLPGANRDGVHYPGPRLRPQVGEPPARVQLTVFDAVGSPSPLMAERHEIDIQLKAGVLEITETVTVNNPTSTTYVGGADRKTLSLSIPEGFERVTFANEFHGRRFVPSDKTLETDIPWPPGKRELAFTYHLPVADSRQTLERALDLPCQLVRVRVRGENADQVVCNLPRVGSDTTAPVFESSGKTLEAGHKVTLQLSRLSAPWFLSARWGALAVLGGLVFVTAGLPTLNRYRRRRQRPESDSPKSSGDRSSHSKAKRRQRRGASRHGA